MIRQGIWYSGEANEILNVNASNILDPGTPRDLKDRLQTTKVSPTQHRRIGFTGSNLAKSVVIIAIFRPA